MISILFRCRSCGEPCDLPSFPLCFLCEKALVPAPRLCPICAGLSCPPLRRCERPWHDCRDFSGIRSYSARYLMMSSCYAVLRSWKNQGGLLLSRKVLNWDDFEIPRPWNYAQAVIPIPQRMSRSWSLGRSPALEIAESCSSLLKIPVLQAFRENHHQPINLVSRKLRQAQRSGTQRLESELRSEFEIEPRARAQLQSFTSTILVDDFMTTGHTLRQGARLLHEAGLKRIHVFVLGIRPVGARGEINLNTQAL